MDGGRELWRDETPPLPSWDEWCESLPETDEEEPEGLDIDSGLNKSNLPSPERKLILYWR